MDDMKSFLNQFGDKNAKKKEKTWMDEISGSKFKQPEKREREIVKFIDSLKELWLKYPEQRFSQLLYNFTKMGTPISKELGPSEGLKDFFYYLDKDLIEDININLKKDKNGKKIS